jgi:hypothetical protein
MTRNDAQNNKQIKLSSEESEEESDKDNKATAGSPAQ